jgi:hypothetical protein
MSTLFDRADRTTLLYRIDRLQATNPRLWGKMELGEMLVHAAEQLRLGLGEIPVEERKTPFNRPLVRQFIVYLMPWPKGSPTAPELIPTSAVEVEEGKARLAALVGRFGERTPDDAWPVHPAFGPLSGKAWGVLSYRHLDHHLRQFNA